MRKGKGKSKGSSFERVVCKQLSEWVSKGRRTDLFWRTAISGGRATVARRKGVVVRQAGDICAVSPEGHALTDYWYIECKFYRRIMLAEFLINNQGPIVRWWKTAKHEARQHGLEPMLIIKQNKWPVLVITRWEALERFTEPQLRSEARGCDVSFFDDMLLTEFWGS